MGRYGEFLGTDQVPKFYGPYSTGAVSVVASGDVSFDVPVDAAVLLAPAKRVILGAPDGTSGAFEFLTWGVQQSVIVAGSLRLWFHNTNTTTATNFTFNFMVLL